LKKGIFIGEHMTNYTKLLVGLANVEEVIMNEDKALILLSSLLDEEYETFVLTLINGKQSLSYNEVSAALVNYEIRWKDKESSNSISAEALATKGIGSDHRKGKEDIGKIDNCQLRKNKCAFYKEEEH